MKNIVAVRMLLLANFISGIAQGISMISIPMYFSESNQSNWFNIAYGLITVVTLFWSPYGGTLVDKYDRKRIFLTLNLINGVAIGTIAYLEWQGLVDTSYLAASVFALTFWNYNLHYPCFYAFMQEITEKEYYNKIASYIEVQSQLATALAGAGAAFLLGGGLMLNGIDLTFSAWSLAEVFALDATTYFASFGIIWLLRYVPMVTRTEETGGVWKRLHTGYQYLIKHPYIFIFGIATHAVFVVVLLHVFNLAPLYVKQHLQADNANQVFAISEMFYALGAIIAGLGIQRIFNKTPFVKAIVILMFITIGEFIFFISTYWIIGFYLVTLLLGVTNAGIRVIRISYLFTVLPNHLMGRANSIFFVSNTLGRILFLALFSLPFFHQDGQVIYAFAILTIFMAICASILLFFYSKIALNKEPDYEN